MSEVAVRYSRSSKIDVSRVGSRAILYHRETGKALVLNPTGSWLWDQLSDAHSNQALADALQTQHPALPPAQAAQDVSKFLSQLQEHDAVTVERKDAH